jgi:hypothetical protein
VRAVQRPERQAGQPTPSQDGPQDKKGPRQSFTWRQTTGAARADRGESAKLRKRLESGQWGAGDMSGGIASYSEDNAQPAALLEEKCSQNPNRTEARLGGSGLRTFTIAVGISPRPSPNDALASLGCANRFPAKPRPTLAGVGIIPCGIKGIPARRLAGRVQRLDGVRRGKLGNYPHTPLSRGKVPSRITGGAKHRNDGARSARASGTADRRAAPNRTQCCRHGKPDLHRGVPSRSSPRLDRCRA